MTTSSAALGGTRRSAIREFSSAVATIMVKELRSRMRGRRAFVVLTAYLGVLALIAYGVYAVVAPAARAMGGEVGVGGGLGGANASALIGQTIFSVLSVFQVILVSMIAPAFTAGQISLEREKQTLDLLISTPLRPGAIVIGKLLTALAFVVLMILAAVPITAIVLMYGGASLVDIARQQALLLAVAVGFGAVGLFASALMRRTQAATVLAYCTVLALTLGTAMIFAFWTQIAQRDQGFAVAPRQAAPEQLRYLNPMVGMLDIVSTVEATGSTPFTGPLYQLFGNDLAAGQVAIDDCFGFGCPPDAGQRGNIFGGTSGYWWPRVTVSFLVIGAVLTLISMRLVVPPGMRWAFRRRTDTYGFPTPMGAAGAFDEGAPTIEEFGEAER